MTFDLTRFGPEAAQAMPRGGVGRARRRPARWNAPRRPSAAHSTTDLTDATGERACVLVRCYVTHPYGALPPNLQRFAKRALGTVAITPPEPAMRCLVLLATVGDEPAWNDRRRSAGHQAIPLPSPHIVERAPMIAQLVRELGLDLAHVARPATGVVHDLGGAGTRRLPRRARGGQPDTSRRRRASSTATAFARCSASAALLDSGELFAAILFARVPYLDGRRGRLRRLRARCAGGSRRARANRVRAGRRLAGSAHSRAEEHEAPCRVGPARIPSGTTASPRCPPVHSTGRRARSPTRSSAPPTRSACTTPSVDSCTSTRWRARAHATRAPTPTR